MSYPSKNSYGNKTIYELRVTPISSYPSKNSYGNKTPLINFFTIYMSYPSKNSYGNKTSNTCYHIFKNNKICSFIDLL